MFLHKRDALKILGAAMGGFASGSFAQSAVTKFILPVSAGSGVDGIARAASNTLAKALGTSVVIENQPGAGGIVGTQNMIRSAPDGATLSFVSNNHVIYPSVTKNLSFDPVADITPIAVIGATPLVLVVNPKIPANNLREFTSLLRKNPGKYNYASSGNGTILHLAAEVFKEATQTFSTHIPYRGFAPMMQDIVGGQVDWGIGALPAVAGQVKNGNLRALAIASPQRSPAAPEIPSALEAGAAGFQIEGWIAVVGPKGMSNELVTKIHKALSTTFAAPEVMEAMNKQGNIIKVRSPEESKAFFSSELNRYAALVKKAGVVPA